MQKQKLYLLFFTSKRGIFIFKWSNKTPLVYTTPSSNGHTSGTSTTGKPNSFTILGDTFRFSPKPDATYTAINYY